MLAHAEAVVEWNGSQTALRTFQHASWYLTGFAVGKDIRRKSTNKFTRRPDFSH